MPSQLLKIERLLKTQGCRGGGSSVHLVKIKIPLGAQPYF